MSTDRPPTSSRGPASSRRPTSSRGSTSSRRPGPSRPARGGRTRVRLASSAGRLRVFVLLIAVLFSLVAGRAVQIQVLDAKAMASEAAAKMDVSRTLPAVRGSILGRDGQLLAFTETTVNVIADPSSIATNGKDAEAAKQADLDRGIVAPLEMAQIIARYVQGDALLIEQQLRRKESKYQILAKQVPASVFVDLIAELNRGDYVGIFRESNPRRVYPMGSVASNVVGFMSEGHGLGGLEYARETDLAGVDGKETYETSPHGRIPLGNQVLEPAKDGVDITLTLDPDFQWMVEQRLRQRVDEVSGLWGVAVVMDVETGELLALANYPSYDSNDPGAGATQDMGNRAVTATYEPGSVQKVLTLASLLDAGLTTPDQVYSIGPTVKVGDHEVTDAFNHGEIDITTRGIVVRSSNVGAITAARAMDSDDLRQYMLDFGLGAEIGLGLPGEGAGRVPAAGMPSYTADSMAFGYGVSVTAVQMAAAVAAVANDGVYTEPSIVSSVANADGSVLSTNEPEQRRVISEEAARETIGMMEQRTIYDADRIGIPGYRSASKTGTARFSGDAGSGYTGQVASMVGVAPAEDPQILVYVLVARPDTSGGGLGMAGPVYRDVMQLALPRYGVRPSDTVPDTVLPLVVE